ncbi:MAG TPA: prephenate dehydratase [Pyrinomonadaceae bacterium]|nr:prephenate dehydratase [Pyrinomonadaceae bacterium]
MNDSKINVRVAFQGECGAFSEQAALKLLGEEIELVPRPTFDSLFASISEGSANRILAPLENTLAGSVHRSYDLLLESSLVITGEVIIPIAHHLVGCQSATFDSLRTVESHPVALAQCERFFSDHPHIQRVVSEDTAGSVRSVIAHGDSSRAAIASERAANVYRGKILQRHLEDYRDNYTRFVLLEPPSQGETKGDKLSLMLELSHRPAALHRALVPFARRGINLLKIESRPIKGSPWQYRFYIDLQASTNDSKVVSALRELERCTEKVRILGCYPSFHVTTSANGHNNASTVAINKSL